MDPQKLTILNTIVTIISILVSIVCAIIAIYQAYKASKHAKKANEIREDLLKKVSYVNLKGYHAMFPIAHRCIMSITEEEKNQRGNDLREKLAPLTELVSTYQTYAKDFVEIRHKTDGNNYCSQIYQFMANDIDIRPLNTAPLIRCITELERIISDEMSIQSNTLTEDVTGATH